MRRVKRAVLCVSRAIQCAAHHSLRVRTPLHVPNLPHSPKPERGCLANASLKPMTTGRELLLLLLLLLPPPPPPPPSACAGALPSRISLAMVGAAILSMLLNGAGWGAEGVRGRSRSFEARREGGALLLLLGEGLGRERRRLLPNAIVTCDDDEGVGAGGRGR